MKKFGKFEHLLDVFKLLILKAILMILWLFLKVDHIV